MECPDFLTALAQIAVQRPTLNLWTPGTNLLISARWIDDSGEVRDSSNYMSFLLHGRSKPINVISKMSYPSPFFENNKMFGRKAMCLHP